MTDVAHWHRISYWSAVVGIVVNGGATGLNFWLFIAGDTWFRWVSLSMALIAGACCVLMVWLRRKQHRWVDGRCPEEVWVRPAVEAPRVTLRCMEDAGHKGQAHVAPYQANGPPVEFGGAISAHSELNLEFTALGLKWWEVPIE